MRVTTLEKSVNDATNEEVEIEGDEGWVQTHVGYKNPEDDDIPEIGVDDDDKPTNPREKEEKAPSASSKEPQKEDKKKNSDDDIPDIDDFSMDDNLEEDDPVSSSFIYSLMYSCVFN